MKLVKNKAPSKTREILSGVVLGVQTLSLLTIAGAVVLIALELAPQAKLASSVDSILKQFFQQRQQ